MSDRRRKFWGWGFEDQQPAQDEVDQVGLGAREHLGFGPAEVESPARLEDLELPAPRIEDVAFPTEIREDFDLSLESGRRRRGSRGSRWPGTPPGRDARAVAHRSQWFVARHSSFRSTRHAGQ